MQHSRLPDVEFSSTELVKILSMRALERTVKCAGIVIWEVNDAENISSKNSLVGLLDS